MSEANNLPSLPSISGAAISVLLLAHNEQAHVGDVVESWMKQLAGLRRDYQIIVVDDGSTDRTAEILDGLARQQPHLQVLRHSTALGNGAALKTGLAAARHPLLFYTTCDRQYLPVDLHPLLAEIDKLHMVAGYRRWQQAPRWLQRLGKIWRAIAKVTVNLPMEPLPGWLGWKDHCHALFMRIVFGIRLHDADCRFRLFRRALFERIPVQSQGEFVHDEILAKANFLGAMMTDVAIQYHPRDERPSESLRRCWRDFRLVFSHPAFGPAHLGQGSQFAALEPVAVKS